MTNRLTGCCLFLLSMSVTQAKITALCSTGDKYWEVQEDKQNNTFSCTGLSAQDTLTWNIWLSNDRINYLGSCAPRPSACSSQSKNIFMPSRMSDDTGVILVNPTTSSDTVQFEQGRLVCTAIGSGVPGVADGCRLDYIHAGESISCTVQYRNDNWTMFGQCTIGKAYSAQNRYRCEWIQTEQLSGETVLIGNTTMSVVVRTSKAVAGSCTLTRMLPPDGQYTYQVTVVPGEVKVTASFRGSNTIRFPSSAPYHNCPQYVPEGGSLNCTCSVSDLGDPLGTLKWNTTQTVQLALSNAQFSDSGTHVCQLFWNDTLVQSVYYVLRVAYFVPAEPVTENNTTAVVVLAVLLSVVLILFIIAAVCSWRRGWILPCADANKVPANQAQPRSDVYEDCSVNPTTRTSRTREGGTADAYAGLRAQDVGVRSSYEGMHRDTNI